MRRPLAGIRWSLRSLLLAAVTLTGATAFAGPATIDARALALPALADTARSEAVFEDDVPQLVARLLATGDPVDRVGVLFDLAPGWHLYWKNPGDTGIPPQLDLTGADLRVGEIAWPAPETFEEADGLFTTYGYEGSVLLAAPVEAAPTPDAQRTIRADVSVLICRTQCVPVSFSLVSPLDPRLPRDERTAVEALFRSSASRVPRPAEELGIEATAVWVGEIPSTDGAGRVELSIRSCARASAGCGIRADDTNSLFIPMAEEAFEFSGARVVDRDREADTLKIELGLTRLEETEDRLRGLLRTRTLDGRLRHVELDLPIGSPRSSAAVPAAPLSQPWLRIVLLALLGGLILNGMPCVLPVLAIKVVSIADMAEREPRDVRWHGLAYTAGVLGSMGGLAVIVIGLRSAGHSVGWGFQFQEPLFVAGISAVLVGFALNLFGVFEIELGQGRLARVGQESTGLSRSFFEGLLAVVLATPCTAPFLGTAVGFAFATTGLGIIAIFLAIGLGLAAPFLAVSFSPGLVRFIPRSGPWMQKLRVCLGFCLVSTVLWLLWVLGQSSGLGAVIAMAANLLFLAFLLWVFGQTQALGSAWLGRASAVAIPCLAIASFNLIDFDRAAASAHSEEALDFESRWQRYSEQAVSEAVLSGRTAFVVFTADWCITCQLNERSVLERAVVHEGFDRGGVALFKADWTRRDEGIRRKLAEFGRAGVPLYLVYSPAAPDDPQILSEWLTAREVLGALEDAAQAPRIGPTGSRTRSHFPQSWTPTRRCSEGRGSPTCGRPPGEHHA